MCTKYELKVITEEVNKELQALFGEQIDRIILYGSYARGDYTQESDIDIMLIMKCSKSQIQDSRHKVSKVASRIGLENDVMVSILIRDREEFEQKEDYPFYRNIKREGIAIYGAE